MAFRVKKDAHGKIVGYEFSATTKMYRVVTEFNKTENSTLSNEEILDKCKISQNEYDRWWQDFVIHEYDNDGNPINSRNLFEEWFDSALQIKSGDERQLLRMIGMTKAMEGHLGFWKELARTYGAISPEAVHHTHQIIPFNLKDDATPEQIKDERQKRLQSHRSLDGSGGNSMARLSAGRHKSKDN